MEISNFITLSTAHIRPATAAALSKCVDEKSGIDVGTAIVVYPKADYGWFLYFNADEMKAKENQIPEDLLACIQFAIKQGCSMLCLDRDGEEVFELPDYTTDWEHQQFRENVQTVLDGQTKNVGFDSNTLKNIAKFSEVARNYGFTICLNSPSRREVRFQKGICPVCGNATLRYLDATPDFLPWECTHCHSTGEEGCDYKDDGFGGTNKVFDGFHYNVKDASGDPVKFCFDCFPTEGGRRHCICSNGITVMYLLAKNTDGEDVAWFKYDPSADITACYGNTDHLNIWLHETRPDFTPEKCVQFVHDLNKAFGLVGSNCYGIHEVIDPEDWQELANVPDAYEDERYTQYR